MLTNLSSFVRSFWNLKFFVVLLLLDYCCISDSFSQTKVFQISHTLNRDDLDDTIWQIKIQDSLKSGDTINIDEREHFMFRTFHCKAFFAGSRYILFNVPVFFAKTKFDSLTIFVNIGFRGIVSFSGAEFKRRVAFSDLTFSQNVMFGSYVGYYDWKQYLSAVPTFNDTVQFDNIKFKYLSQFAHMKWGGVTSFNNIKFLGTTVFSHDFFVDNVVFKSCDFRKMDRLGFSDSYFQKSVLFDGDRFNQIVDFSFSKFSNKASFSNLELTDSANFDFNSTMFPDTLDFSFNSHIHNDIDLSTGNFTTDSSHYTKSKDEFKKPYLILLYKTDINKFHLDYSHFKLFLPDSIKNPLNDSSYLIVSNDEKELMYEALLNNFKNRGQEESYQLLDIEYKKFKFNMHWYTIPLLYINDFWWNFGYNKGRVFFWAFLFIIFFTCLNYFYLPILNRTAYTMENMPPIYKMKNFKSRLWYSFVYSSSIFFRLTLKIERINFQNKKGTFYIILIYLLGLVSLAYMANYIIQK